MEKRGGLERAQLFDALFKLVLLVLELLLFAQALTLLERLVLAMPLFVRRIRGVDAFLWSLRVSLHREKKDILNTRTSS